MILEILFSGLVMNVVFYLAGYLIIRAGRG